MNAITNIFVFGSNLAGRHGAGAAAYAHRKLGAQYGVGEGPTGFTYALPTMDGNIRPLSLTRIKVHVHRFITYAEANPNLTFQVTCVGCGLGGKTHADIAPLFATAPDNCQFDTLWEPWLGADRTYWGTF